MESATHQSMKAVSEEWENLGRAPEARMPPLKVIEGGLGSEGGREQGEGPLAAPKPVEFDGVDRKLVRGILDQIDAQILEASETRNRVDPRGQANRDKVAIVLDAWEGWREPVEIYAGGTWEITLVWKTGYGVVELGTEPDGRISYLAKRTLMNKQAEGFIDVEDQEGEGRGGWRKIGRLMTWLERDREEDL